MEGGEGGVRLYVAEKTRFAAIVGLGTGVRKRIGR